MSVDFLRNQSNMIRVPVERRARPSLEVMRELAPDVREVLAIAEAFGMDTPAHDLRARVDEETAEHIAVHLASNDPPYVRTAFLDKLLDPLVAGTIEACREVRASWIEATRARDALHEAPSAGENWSGIAGQRADTLVGRAAAFLIIAHARVEETEGVVRAVGFARRGEPWVTRDHDAETDALLAYRWPA